MKSVQNTAVSSSFDDSDDVKSEYAFEGMTHDSIEKDEVGSVYAMDFETDPMETDDVESVYAFKGTEYDNDDVESVYAFDVSNYDVDTDDDDIPDDKVEFVLPVTEYDNAVTVFREFWVFFVLSIWFIAFGLALFKKGFPGYALASLLITLVVAFCALYNTTVMIRLGNCEKRLVLASSKANAQTSKTRNGTSVN
uniref:Reticulon-like protein n=1 Tax=Panagrellus redivivus TaxID=6233 RepID=A0A7E4UWN0_PANRE